MEKFTAAKNFTERWQKCLQVKLDLDCFPKWFSDELITASNAISVSHEALYHFLVSTTNYCMLHSEVIMEDMEWREPIQLWNLIIASSGSKKSVVYKLFTDMLEDAVKMLQKRDNIEIKQFNFNDGTVEKIGTILNENFGKLSLLQVHHYIFTIELINIIYIYLE